MPFSDSERARHRLQADIRLQKMMCHEHIAQQADDAQTARLRQVFAALYRKLVGIDPADREELREWLEHVRQDGHRPVADMIADLQRQTPNSSSVASSDTAPSV